ncbi:MAG TPA: hypothetical protein VEJ44_02400 [Acidimicrobiales bacterium]|nr:hypothetical protein [Acidimicrobiales bacterium]
MPARRWTRRRGGRTRDGDPGGKRSLYSSGWQASSGDERRRSPDEAVGIGLFAVSCSSCGAKTAVGLLELVALHSPVGAFVPLRRFDHWMRCPACCRRTWAGVTLAR